mgnify:CR=1 FL=1|jgi:hypothetical protein
MDKLDQQIEKKEAWLRDQKAGKRVSDWTPPFSETVGERRVVGGTPGRDSVDSGITGLGALSDHTMDSMSEALEEQIESDHDEIEKQVRQYDSSFDKKLTGCSEY